MIIQIARLKDDVKTYKFPYCVQGEFVFNGTTVETKEVVENIVPFTVTVADKLCTYFTTVLNMPFGNNDFWPECQNAQYTLHYNVLEKNNNPTSNTLNAMLMEAKHSYDIFVCGKDGKAVGLHESVLKVNCKKVDIPSFTSLANPFPLKIGSEQSIRFVFDSMYQISTDIKENSLVFWKEVHSVALNLHFESLLPKVELQMVQQKLSFPELIQLSKEYPNVSSIQKKLLEVVSKDMNAYMSLMDVKEAET